MTTATWPQALPGFNDGLQVRTQQGFVRENPTNGPALTRLETDATSLYYTGEMTFTQAEASVFRSFYHSTLVEGTKPFTMTDPLTGTTETFYFMAAPSYNVRASADADGDSTPVVFARVQLELPP